MRVLLFAIILILTFIFVSGARKPLKPKHTKARPIVGGVNADIANYPYQVSVVFFVDRIRTEEANPDDEPVIDVDTSLAKNETQRPTYHFCGGSVISVDWVLCAAHCLVGKKPYYLGIRVGSSITNTGGKIHVVEKIVVHAEYSKEIQMDHDIALMKVKQPFEFGPSVQPIPLNTQRLRPGMIVTVTGWGVTSMDGELPEILQKVDVPFVPYWECEWLYGKEKLTENMFCGGRAGHDSCQGDSGGPVVYDGRQAGVVSWGEGCALAGYPGIYTDVAKYRTWIRKNSGV